MVVISYGLWQRRFGRDPSLVGRTITLDAVNLTVVGIMPPGFQFPRAAELPAGYGFAPQTDVWVPLARAPNQWKRRDQRNLVVMARLKPGVTLRQAQAEMSTIAQRLAQSYPDSNAGWIVKLVPLYEQIAGRTRPALLILLGAVGFVLLIACANVANLLLARGTARSKEMAIRVALGADRWRIIRQVLTESVLLSLFGGVLGLLLAHWGVALLVAVSPPNIPRLAEARVDTAVLGFTVMISLLTGVLFGLVPALQASRTNLNESLKEGGRRSAAAGRHRARELLIISEVALALVLLAGTGLMIRSYLRLLAVDPGFNPLGVLAMDIMLPGSKYPNVTSRNTFFQQALARLEALAGVRSAGAISDLPLDGTENLTWLAVEGHAPAPRGQEPMVDQRSITPNYFNALGIPLLKGRPLTEHDAAGQPLVVIVNETLARQYFPKEDPIGKRIKLRLLDQNSPWLSIIGVVRDVKSTALEAEPRLQVYESFLQNPYSGMTVVIRTASDPRSLAAAAQAEVRAVDPNQPVFNIRTMEQVVYDSVASRRFHMLLLALFATVALLLTSIGLYGVISYAVIQCTHEIGVRMALGAQPKDVLQLVVRQGMILTWIGMAVGLAASLALTRFMSSLLFGIGATDPATFVGVAFLLTGVALVACYLPARKATQVDPMVALRYE